MSKIDAIIDNNEDWHIAAFKTIANDMHLVANGMINVDLRFSSDMPHLIEQFIERLNRLKGQIT